MHFQLNEIPKILSLFRYCLENKSKNLQEFLEIIYVLKGRELLSNVDRKILVRLHSNEVEKNHTYPFFTEVVT